MKQDIAEIAGKLTKASQRALLKIDPFGWTEEGAPGPSRTDAYSLWWGRDGGKKLVEQPIPFAYSWQYANYKWRLTPLGRQVRSHLLAHSYTEKTDG